jgi:hypothetical protein
MLDQSYRGERASNYTHHIVYITSWLQFNRELHILQYSFEVLQSWFAWKGAAQDVTEVGERLIQLYKVSGCR